MTEYDYNAKAVAAALREFAGVYRKTWGDDNHTSKAMAARADELDPPPPVKSRADRILGAYSKAYWGDEDYTGWGGREKLRRILKEEGIE